VSRLVIAVLRIGLPLALLLQNASPVRGQGVPPPSTSLGPVGQPGLRIVAGQSPVIGGNAAGARERALDEALRQAVDQALAELLDAPTRAAQARAIKVLEGRARTYVRRYRTLDEGEAAGVYTMHLEAEVDEPALRRATERWTDQPHAPAPKVVAPGLLLVPSGAAEAPAALLAALVGLGVRAQLADAPATDAATAVRAAARASLSQVAFVSAEASDEGPIRGTTKLAVSCRVGARLVTVATGVAVGDPAGASRAFADGADVARAECFAKASAELAARLLNGATAAGASGVEPRTVIVDADVAEPGAVVALLKNLRSIGSVSAAEPRRIAPGHVEIRAQTRSLATALAPMLARDSAGTLAISNIEIRGDVIRLRARLRAPDPTEAGGKTP
jgi:hypothetical protein